MEDLLENFSKHVNKVISSKLGSKIRNLSRAYTNYRGEEDFSRLETNIQMLIESYLSNLKENDYKEIANNIFNSFVDEDDKNLIKAVNFYKRTYEHYQELNLRKKFNKWRKTSLKLKMINNLLIKENNLKNKNSKINNLVKSNKSDKSKYENNKIKENVNHLIKSENIDFNFDNNINIKNYEINSYNNLFDEKNEDYVEYMRNHNNENNKFNYKNIMNNNDEYEEE